VAPVAASSPDPPSPLLAQALEMTPARSYAPEDERALLAERSVASSARPTPHSRPAGLTDQLSRAVRGSQGYSQLARGELNCGDGDL
jgi:hypothetical protein